MLTYNILLCMLEIAFCETLLANKVLDLIINSSQMASFCQDNV